jgi:hypothetical protein
MGSILRPETLVVIVCTKTSSFKMVAQQAAEAEATVKPPAEDEVLTVRQIPPPDSEVMVVSMDGAMVNIRGEGWQEVKTVSISAVETVADMRWGRDGAQAMLALRSVLLSERWDDVWATLPLSPKLT